MHPIVRYRTARGLTQATLAGELGVNVNSVRAWELGARPRARYVPSLARVLNVDPVALVDELDTWRRQNVEAGEGKEAA